MNGSAAVALLRNRLTLFSSSSTAVLTDAMILTELSLAQQRLEKEVVLPWWLISERASEQTVPGDERVEVPTQFLREVEVDSLWILDSDGTERQLKKRPVDVAKERHPGTGRPELYGLLGVYFRLFPIADKVYNILMTYFKGDATPTLLTENLWLRYEPDLLLAEAGSVIARLYLRNEAAAAKFEEHRRECYLRLVRNEDARHTTNTEPNPEE